MKENRTQKYWKYLKSFKLLSGDENFDRLTVALRKAGYTVKVQCVSGYKYTKTKVDPPYHAAFVSGKGLVAGYCTLNNDSYSYINNKIAMDKEGWFDKWSKCEYEIDLPSNEQELQEIFDAIDDTVNHRYKEYEKANIKV